MVTDRPPWEIPKPASPAAGGSAQTPFSQTAELERFLTLAEGVVDRLLPRAQKFFEGVQAMRDGKRIEDMSPQQNNPTPQNQVVEGSARPALSALDIYGMIFDMLNLVKDETTCGEMREFLRDNKDTIVAQLETKLNG